jgi:chromosome segregation ATPase
MFNKFTSFMDYIRNQLVNNTELAKQVQEMQQQLSELTHQVNQAVGTNTALQEAVNVLTRERDEVRSDYEAACTKVSELENKFTQRDNDANHWYSEYQKISDELTKVKAERSELEAEHLRLMDEHEKVKDQLARIKSVLSTVQTIPAAVAVEEVHKPEGPQPRDPVTQQWRSWNESTQQWEEKAAS